MTQNEILKLAVKILDGKKAEDIRVIGIRDLTIIADYFIIAGGTSITHARSLADELEFKLKECGITPKNVEGGNKDGWTVLDYSDIVIHIFHKEQREFYNLERLWEDGEEIPVDRL
ncbi:MAG: ribosome silencing factor [Oscillospiraceae bacterium]|nr:ribosome silencing factor [Oscillospiraceae bacterium]